MKKLNEDLLVFVDLETTGLLPHSDSILEVGMLVYDRRSDQVIDMCNWVTKPIQRSINDRTRWVEVPLEEVRNSCDEPVREMHDKNGLWSELETSTTTLFQAGTQIVDWLQMNGLNIEKEIFTPAGNGFDRFDRRFLEHNAGATMNLVSIFHYRSLDISNLHHSLKFVGLDVNEGQDSPPKSNHRALDDCLLALDNWRRIKSYLLMCKAYLPIETISTPRA